MDSEKRKITERRGYTRILIEPDATYKISLKIGEKFIPAKCNNISPQGFCITLKNTASARRGQQFEFDLIIKEKKPIHGKGEIVWIKEIGDGAGDAIGEVRIVAKIVIIKKDDENRFLLELCDAMVHKLNKEYDILKF